MALEMSLGDFDLQRIETWNLPVKIAACVLVFVVIIVGSWFGIHEDQNNELEALEQQETNLRNEFKSKVELAANLDAYKDQIAELESLLEAQLRQLPNSNEVANLLDDISFIAQDNGLNLISIKWEKEVEQEIYTELPMSIVVTGTYEQLGSFSADMASLPRIVTIDQFNLERVKGKNGVEGELLEMKLLAKTFRYNAENAKKKSEREARKGQRRR